MEDRIALISVCNPQELLRLLAKDHPSDIIHYPSLPSRNVLAKYGTVVFDTTERDTDSVLLSINILRSERMFPGMIVITSFLSRNWFAGLEYEVLLNTKGCFYIQLPFLVEEFNQLISRPIRLNNEELSSISRLLLASKLIKNAGYVGHDYKNKFALVLAHLREIEKLSYYKPLQVDLVMEEIETLRCSLTREKVQKFRADMTQLFEDTNECLVDSISKTQLLADDYWKAIWSWLELVEVREGAAAHDITEVFILAKQVQHAIKEILAAIAALKDEAQQVVNHA